MKLFELLTTSMGESYVRSYAWSESQEQALAMFEAGATGYQVAEVIELFSDNNQPFVTRPSDSGFSYENIGDAEPREHLHGESILAAANRNLQRLEQMRQRMDALFISGAKGAQQ